ncbi:MAG: PQQ-dependent sugar dehydrogenase [Phycisphaeraceae bacterium]|nr:PQQ-dependent sugar dehydrogenase [Phycisphaeraceae bacterium]
MHVRNTTRVDGAVGVCRRGALVVAGVMVAAVSGAWGQPLPNPIPEPLPRDGARVRLVPLAAGLTAPNWGTSAPGMPGLLFVTDQTGIVWSIDVATGAKSVFMDLGSRLVSVGIAGPGTYDERGLLGLAFHPGFASNGLLYTYESRPVEGTADFTTLPVSTPANHHTVITEWQAATPVGAGGVSMGSAREVLRIAQPQFNHNGGAIAFGPDGYLYIALGDGGAADDQGNGHGPDGNAQDLGVILGKVLRIDVSGTNSANGRYGIPASNPFVGAVGLDEIYAYGLRNPFRFSFDSLTGELWLADVGQNHIEEINLIKAGGNYGWRVKEGTFLFDANGNGAGFVFKNSPGQPADMIDPVAQYDHDEGIAVVGGFVYRGGRIPALYGRYVFGELSPQFGVEPGRLFHLDGAMAIHEMRYAGMPLGLTLQGFGTDGFGRLYAMGNFTGLPGDTAGMVLRLEPACAADYDVSGTVEPADVAAFVQTWARALTEGTLEADFDTNGEIGPTDLSGFVNDWFVAVLTGC